MSLEGQTLDIYEIGAELGRGGMGSVWRAVSSTEGAAGPAGTEVAIKVLHPELADDERHLERFRREGEVGLGLRHPHVVRTHAVGHATLEEKAHHYIVLEYVEGQTLDSLRDELGIVPDHLLYLIADQTLAGLEALHDRGVIHRDIKPENIVITTSHKVLLMDLGVARLALHGRTMTQAGEFVGSLHYAAPEQLDADTETREACDLYSFGAVLYELATGRRVFDAEDVATLFRQKLQGEFPPPREIQSDIDPFLDEVICTCLDREPTSRFGTAGELRGILHEGTQSEWWQLHSVGRDSSGAERALKRLQLNREVGLIGRNAEMDHLAEAYASLRSGAGRTTLVRGASGTGKSRLVYDFLEGLSSAAGPRVAAGRCVGQGGRAYQAFVDIAHDLLGIEDEASGGRRAALEEGLAAMLPDRPGVVEPLANFILADVADAASPLSQDALLAAFDTVLKHAAAERPLVVVIEDLHLAEVETLDLFDFLTGSLADARVLLLAVYDDGQVEEGARLHRLLAEAEGRDAFDTVRIECLPRAECEVLVRVMVGHQATVHALGDLLFRRSDGNPLLILEVIAQLKATGALAPEGDGFLLTRELGLFDVPTKVAQLIHFKLANLDEDLRETLDTAAVIGQEFQSTILASMLEERRIKVLKRLALLERKYRLLRSTGKDKFRFATPQMGEVLYQGISPDLRGEYHSLAADTLIEAHPSDAPLPGAVAFQVVRHLIAATRGDEVAPLAPSACAHAVGTHHAAYVAAFLERVAEAVQGGDPRVLYDVRLRQWDCYGSLGRRADQVAALDEAHELAQAAQDPRRQAQAICLQGVTQWRTGDYDAAHAKAVEALALARAAGSREWEANALHALGAVVRHWGDFAACAAHWREALEIRREIGDRHGEARSLASLGTVMPEIGEREGALQSKEEALAIFRELGALRGECAMLNNIGNTLVGARRFEEATERFQQAIAIAQRLGSLSAEGHPTCNLGRAYAALGYAAAAQECLTRALTIFRQGRVQSGVMDALRALGEIGVTFGDLEGAGEALREGIELAERVGVKPVQCEFETLYAEVCSQVGDRVAARAGFARALALAEELAGARLRVSVLQAQGTAALRAGEPDEALQPLEEALALATENDLDEAQGSVLAARRAWALWRQGRLDDAKRQGETLAQQVGDGDALSHLEGGAEILYVLGTILGQGGEPYLQRARELSTRHADEIQDPASRDRFLQTTWPARKLGVAAEDV